MKMTEEVNDQQIVTVNKRAYSISEKVFCLRCLHCMQDETIFTSNVRKQTLQRMIKNYVINEDEEALFDPIKLMILIYLCEDNNLPRNHIERCRINPSSNVDTYRTDLEFYIPQLCNYIVFHDDLKRSYLVESIEHACRLDFYFGHLYYFYMLSLEKTVSEYEIRCFKQITEYKDRFLHDMSKMFEGQMLNSFEYYWGEKVKMYPTDPDTALSIKSYGTKDWKEGSQLKVDLKDIYLPNYSSIFNLTEDQEIYSFRSTLSFFSDLFSISEDLKNHEDKKSWLKEQVMKINKKLPACVYIPFSKKSLRFYNVLNILPNESRIFSTKARAPFYICVEVYCPAQVLNEQCQQKFWKKIETPVALKRNLKSESLFNQRLSKEAENVSGRTFHQGSLIMNDPYSNSIQTEVFSERESNRYMNNKLLQFSNDQQTQPRLTSEKSNSKVTSQQMKTLTHKSIHLSKKINEIFGESDEEMYERVKGNSIYGTFESYSLIHLIVKTADNLKQEQFALQLIYQFDYIFKLQKLPLILTPYEVMSMGPDCGIIEMVRDSVTFDKLKKVLKTDLDRPYTLKQFFEIYFVQNLSAAKDKFMRSLVAYSLVMYFLQAKDRHNGNILLHKTGKIFHIDFGFFLSNMPGKGMQLEKDCPFKLLTEYIEVLDGPESFYFKKFREYMFQGYKAVRKHQNKILMLVKMMYSSSGMTMPCFEKGENGILEMQKRFNPPDVMNDAHLNLYCQKLIDSSLDNWAAKWYDRWQYWAQGIFY